LRALWGIEAAAVVFGTFVTLSQHAPAPDTHPLNVSIERIEGGPPAAGSRYGQRLNIHAGDGSLSVRAGALSLFIQPNLRFLSRSPDGCQTILAPREFREGREPRLIAERQSDKHRLLGFRSDYEATLRVDHDDGFGPILLEACARLPEDVYSHLNSFCDIDVTGHQKLALSFSPCPDKLVDVLPSEYPAGRPLRLAHLDAVGTFHVVEASSGEKGPFRSLAKGPLKRGEPLGITIYDRSVATVRVVLHDWSAQAATQLSPTAGWGLPVNATEFSLQGSEDRSPASIYVTLAATSVGRGWDSVGHRAGTYRNRVEISALGDRPELRDVGPMPSE
jgi:hypothetical protein